METWRPEDGARTHCSFCKKPITGNASVTSADAIAPDYSDTGFLRAGKFGALGAVILWLVLTAPGLIIMLLTLAFGSQTMEEPRAPLSTILALYFVESIAIATLGFIVGILGLLIYRAVFR